MTHSAEIHRLFVQRVLRAFGRLEEISCLWIWTLAPYVLVYMKMEKS